MSEKQPDKPDRLWEGMFNYKGETFTLFTKARSKVGAFYNCVYQLGPKLGLSSYVIRNSFLGKNNWEIKEVKNEKEAREKAG